VRPKKQKKEVPTKKEEPSDTHSQDDDASSGSGNELKEINSANKAAAVESKSTNLVHNESIFDIGQLYEQIMKLNNPNYAGNPNLSWGRIKLQLQTRNIEELRRKFNELNVTLRQVGVDEERSFMDERILIGERLL
jgi:hypothetical protein